MAEYRWVAGPLLLLLLASVIYGYVRTVARWEAQPEPAPQPERQPELL
jgi:hypothetical protein